METLMSLSFKETQITNFLVHFRVSLNYLDDFWSVGLCLIRQPEIYEMTKIVLRLIFDEEDYNYYRLLLFFRFI